ncbi:MAG: hypothetical protein ACRDI3_01515 [Actinomycetota bacterium]
MNFVFRDNRGNRYVGTAGHCALKAPGQRVWSSRSGPQANDGDGDVIGRFTYAIWHGAGDAADFALVRLFARVKTDAEMCHFGGPTGIDSSSSSDPVVLQFFGNGAGIGNLLIINQTVLPGRSAVAPEMRDREEVLAPGVAVAGDSGAPVTESSQDRAIGLLVGARPDPFILVTRIEPAMRRAERALGVDLRMVTAKAN